ncbi:MAG TPA: hypothetical protein VI791_01135 [Patescibacteria group bacterium]|nr:hypothetical protein [Patescibacteria group bacterium]
MNNLTTKADGLYEKSNKLLDVFPFIQVASKYFNRVTLVGSASMNLMTDADIDIDCEVDKLDKNAVTNFVNELLDYKECRKVIVYNQFFDERPYCIVNIERFNFAGEKWIITFFVSTNLNNTTELAQQIKSKLTPEKRITILQFKEYRQNNKQKRSIASHLIYEAVLNKDITTIDDFKTFLSSKDVDPNKQDEKNLSSFRPSEVRLPAPVGF